MRRKLALWFLRNALLKDRLFYYNFRDDIADCFYQEMVSRGKYFFGTNKIAIDSAENFIEQCLKSTKTKEE